MKIITLTNEKQQRNKRSRKSPNANEHFSLTDYLHFRRLDFFKAHEDYYEEFFLSGGEYGDFLKAVELFFSL